MRYGCGLTRTHWYPNAILSGAATEIAVNTPDFPASTGEFCYAWPILEVGNSQPPGWDDFAKLVDRGSSHPLPDWYLLLAIWIAEWVQPSIRWMAYSRYQIHWGSTACAGWSAWRNVQDNPHWWMRDPGTFRRITPMLSRIVGTAQSKNNTPTADAHYVGWS